jgi:hypothetical protein
LEDTKYNKSPESSSNHNVPSTKFKAGDKITNECLLYKKSGNEKLDFLKFTYKLKNIYDSKKNNEKKKYWYCAVTNDCSGSIIQVCTKNLNDFFLKEFHNKECLEKNSQLQNISMLNNYNAINTIMTREVNPDNIRITKERVDKILDCSPEINFRDLLKILQEENALISQEKIGLIIEEHLIRNLMKQYKLANKSDIKDVVVRESLTKDKLLFIRGYRTPNDFKGGMCNNTQLILLASNWQLTQLKLSKNLYIDCTFGILPRPFKQLMIIASWNQEFKEYYPVAFILLSHKTQLIYREALMWVREELRKSNDDILPCDKNIQNNTNEKAKTIVCDFEAGLLNATEIEFPEFTLIGDLFHLKNRLWLGGMKKGLGTKDNKPLLIYLVNKFGSLHFKKEEEFPIAFQILKDKINGSNFFDISKFKGEKVEFLYNNDTKKKAISFLKYFENNFLDSYYEGTTNYSFTNPKQRSTGFIEKYNSFLKSKIPHQPTLTNLINVLCSEEFYFAQRYLTHIRLANLGENSKKKVINQSNSVTYEANFKSILIDLKLNSENYLNSCEFFEYFNKEIQEIYSSDSSDDHEHLSNSGSSDIKEDLEKSSSNSKEISYLNCYDHPKSPKKKNDNKNFGGALQTYKLHQNNGTYTKNMEENEKNSLIENNLMEASKNEPIKDIVIPVRPVCSKRKPEESLITNTRLRSRVFKKSSDVCVSGRDPLLRTDIFWYTTTNNSCRYDCFLLFYYMKIFRKANSFEIQTKDYEIWDYDIVYSNRVIDSSQELTIMNEYLQKIDRSFQNSDLLEDSLIEGYWIQRWAEKLETDAYGDPGVIHNLFNIFYGDLRFNLHAEYELRCSKKKCLKLEKRYLKNVFHNPIITFSKSDLNNYIISNGKNKKIRLLDLFFDKIIDNSTKLNECFVCKKKKKKNLPEWKSTLESYALKKLIFPEFLFFDLDFLNKGTESIECMDVLENFLFEVEDFLDFSEKKRGDFIIGDVLFELITIINFVDYKSFGHYNLEIKEIFNNSKTDIDGWFSYDGRKENGKLCLISQEKRIKEILSKKPFDLKKKPPIIYPILLCYKRLEK